MHSSAFVLCTVVLLMQYSYCERLAMSLYEQKESESHSVVSDSLRPPRTIQSMEFSRPEYWSGQPFSSSGNLPNPGIELRSPALQADSLPTELSGKPKFSLQCSPYFHAKLMSSVTRTHLLKDDCCHERQHILWKYYQCIALESQSIQKALQFPL